MYVCMYTSLYVCIHSFEEGNGIPLQYSCLENPTDGGAWWAAVYGVTQSPTRLTRLSSSSSSSVHSLLEKEMAPHSNILAWEIPWTEEPGEPQSMGLQRVRHDLATTQQQHTFFVCIHCNNTAFVSEVKDISNFPL